jgi:hypothetical protein
VLAMRDRSGWSKRRSASPPPRGLEKSRLELLTVGAIVDPFAGCGDPLAGRDDGGARMILRLRKPE